MQEGAVPAALGSIAIRPKRHSIESREKVRALDVRIASVLQMNTFKIQEQAMIHSVEMLVPIHAGIHANARDT